VSISAQLLILVSAAAAVWVFLDARARLRGHAAAAWAVGTLLAVGLALPAYLLIRPSRSTTWGLGEVLGLTLFFIMAVPLLGSWLSHAPAGQTPPLPTIAVLVVFQNAAFVLAALYVVHVKYHLPLASLGLRGGAWMRWLGQGGAAAVAALLGNSVGQNATVFALALVMGQRAASEFITREEVRTPIYRILPQLHQRLELAVLAVLIGIAVPVGEEIFFRGLVFGALRRRLDRHVAVLLSALFFAGAHLQPVEFLPIVILGTILAYTYEFTGALIPGMIAHGVNNLAALLIFYQNPPGGP